MAGSQRFCRHHAAIVLALGGCDAVFHLAGMLSATRPRAMLRTNGGGTRRLADACAALPTPPRFVYVSSLAAAGPTPRGRAFRDEADPATPVSRYGRGKRNGEVALARRAGQGVYLTCDYREHPTYWEFGHRVAAQRLGGPASVLTRDKIREATAWNWGCSAAKARNQLDFQPAFPLDVRLAETAEWFRDHGWL